MHKHEVGSLPYTIYKNQLRMDQRPKTLKPFEENTVGSGGNITLDLNQKK